MNLLITGANGFVGRALCPDALARGFRVRAASREAAPVLSGMGHVTVGDIDAGTDWQTALRDVDVVVHLAARVHVLHDVAADRLGAFRRTNVSGTLNLANQAARAGVGRFVYLSSVKVNGEFTERGQMFSAGSAPDPVDPYGVSKWEAEQGLFQLSRKIGMEVVCIRSPLVYGPGVKANFRAMMRWVHRGVPLPFGSVTDNRRSLVALDNLVSLIATCVDHPRAAQQTFLVSDGEDVSTTELLARLAHAMNVPARLFSVPPALLRTGLGLFGKGDVAQRLLGSLQVNIAHTCDTVDWRPPLSLDEGLRRAAGAFIA